MGQKGRTGILTLNKDEIQVNRDDFIYDVELLPGQEFSGYIYHWTEGDVAWGDLHEEPEVGWLEVSPSSFTIQGCEEPLPVKFTFRAPQKTGTYSTTVEDWEYSWPDNKITLTVTEHPTYKITDSVIIVEGPGSFYYRYQDHEYHGINPAQSWWDDGYCGEDPYIVNPTRKIAHAIFPPRPDIIIDPSSFILQLNEERTVSKSFGVVQNTIDSFYESVSSQWLSYPKFTKWKLIPADNYCLGWDQIPKLIKPSVQSGAEVINELIYLAGGFDPFTNEVLDRMEIFDGNSWTVSTAAMNESRYAFAHALLEDRLYVFGGMDNNHMPTNSIEYYYEGFWNPSTDAMPITLAGHSGAVYANSFYVFGGKGNDGYHSSLWKFSSQSGWTVISDTLPFSAREGYQCVRIDRDLYILGGFYSEDGTDSTFYKDVYIYIPSTNDFSTINPMNRARANFACGVVNGLLYVAGGESNNTITTTTIEFYDPDTEKWLSCNDAPDLSILPAAYTVMDNRLFLLGGSLSDPNTTPTYRTCYGSRDITAEPADPPADPQPTLIAYPNPMRENAVFTFDLPYDSEVTLRLFDLSGRLIENIVDEYLLADEYQVTLEGKKLAQGLYLGWLQTEKHKVVKKVVKVTD